MTPQAYLYSHIYDDMLAALERVVENHDPACPYSRSMLRTYLMLALGETGGVWPASIYQGEDAGPSVFVMV